MLPILEEIALVNFAVGPLVSTVAVLYIILECSRKCA